MKNILYVLKSIWNWIVVMWEVVIKEAYLSTRISDNKERKWRKEENYRLAYKRYLMWRMLGLDALNPVDHQMKGWKERDYMRMWRCAIRLMKILNKPMISYEDDIPWSKGCTEEVELAKEIHMRIINGISRNKGICKRVYFDLDGTIIDDRIDRIFIIKEGEVGSVEALKWYKRNRALWENKSYDLNYYVLLIALSYRLRGYECIIFTNRFPRQIDSIRYALGNWAWIFNGGYRCYCGYKAGVRLDGPLYDNSRKAAVCTNEFHYVNTFTTKGGE